ncbi:GAF domain-containing protein [Calothrix rhizosoleniae]|uniref:GAF domain-containing protein n=1 Tax=Calothrix rhizosoleniae TaxID=888997 RepID=UPI001F4452DB|nr:GAF domain-containing protein [Calothrix rhizosoleniae]
MPINFQPEFTPNSVEQGLQRIINRLTIKMRQDTLVRQTTQELREFLEVNRVVLYYFYNHWHGQVTFESLSDEQFSILGSTGPDECFTDQYADLYLSGRFRAIPDIEVEEISDCHRDFLRSLNVRANLAVPVLIPKGLWGLLVAHHCQAPHNWSKSDIEMMKAGAEKLATAPCILES